MVHLVTIPGSTRKYTYEDIGKLTSPPLPARLRRDRIGLDTPAYVCDETLLQGAHKMVGKMAQDGVTLADFARALYCVIRFPKTQNMLFQDDIMKQIFFGDTHSELDFASFKKDYNEALASTAAAMK